MNSTTPPSFSAELEICVPGSWSALDDDALLLLSRLIGECADREEVKARFLLSRCLTPSEALRFSPSDLLVAFPPLEWIDAPPSVPVRPSRIGERLALDAHFQGVAFETYLVAENLYQGYLSTRRRATLSLLFDVLYPPTEDSSPPAPPLDAATQEGVVLLWWWGLKSHFSHTFPDLFRPADSGSISSSDMAASMNAQIRALTGGDITKEPVVLGADTWRALTELDAKARDARLLEERRSV